MSNIKLEVNGNQAIVTLAKSDKINFLDLNDILDLNEILYSLSKTKDLDLVVIRSEEGYKVFCAGISIKDHLYPKFPAMLAGFAHTYHLMQILKPITICYINGSAIGGGLEIALACDYIVSTKKSKFCLPEITLNVLPPIACFLLPQIINPEASIDLICSGKKIEADEAKNIGLVDYVIDDNIENKNILALLKTPLSKRLNRLNNIKEQNIEFRNWAYYNPIVKSKIKDAILTGINYNKNYKSAFSKINELYAELMENEEVNNALLKFLTK